MVEPQRLSDLKAFEIRSILEFVSPFVVPFCWSNDEHGKGGVFASGWLLEIAGFHFVITAGHVVHDLIAIEDGRNKGQSVTSWGIPLKKGHGVSVYYPGPMNMIEWGEDDPCTDIGCLRLMGEEFIKLIKEGRRFLSLEQIAPHPRYNECLVYGFPAAQSTYDGESVRSKPFKFVTTTMSNAGWPDGLSNGDNIVLNKPTEAFSTNQVQRLPNHAGLKGISGSPIWNLLPAPGVWTAERSARVVGIQTRVPDSPPCIVGTQIHVLAQALAQDFPTLREPIVRWRTRHDQRNRGDSSGSDCPARS